MGLLWSSLLILSAAVMQSVVFSRYLAPLDARVDLALVLVVCWSILRGPDEGIVAGLIAGMALDMMSGGPMGTNTGALALVGLLTGMGEAQLYRGNLPLLMGAGAGATVAFHTTTFLTLQATGWQPNLSPSLMRSLLFSVATSAAATPIAFRGLARFVRMITKSGQTMGW